MDPTAGDLGKVSEAFAKLAELVSGFVARNREPKRIRAEAQAKADAMLLVTDAEIAVQRKRTDAEIQDFEVRMRARDRFVKEQVLFQTNMEEVVNCAEAALPGQVSKQPVSPDWTTEFFEHARHISAPEMQELWGRLLAGEAADERGRTRDARLVGRVKAQVKAGSTGRHRGFSLYGKIPYKSQGRHDHGDRTDYAPLLARTFTPDTPPV